MRAFWCISKQVGLCSKIDWLWLKVHFVPLDIIILDIFLIVRIQSEFLYFFFSYKSNGITYRHHYSDNFIELMIVVYKVCLKWFVKNILRFSVGCYWLRYKIYYFPYYDWVFRNEIGNSIIVTFYYIDTYGFLDLRRS